MENVVVLADIHANLPALKAVLRDLKARGLENAVKLFLGDYVNLGAFPNETIDFIKTQKRAVFIRGNHDRYMSEGYGYSSSKDRTRDREIANHTRWTRSAIGRANLDWLKELPPVNSLRVDGNILVMLHGEYSGEDDEESISKLQRMKDREESVVMLHGHVHRQSYREQRQLRMINPGSVGCLIAGGAFDGAFGVASAEASYCVLHIDKNFFEVTFRRVEYSPVQLVEEIRRKKVPWGERVAASLATGII